jgi:biofilm PGA synthesis N-glycosyltransferase PgaC
MRLRIALITPCFNEQATVGGLAASLDAQTRRPDAWVVVDDASTDATGRVARELAASRPWMMVVDRVRAPGYAADRGAEAAAFNAGIDQLAAADVAWDVVSKLDADLVLAPDYLRLLGDAFAADPALGLAGGAVLVERRGRLVVEDVGPVHVRGATKAYRREALAAIGGRIAERLGWDTVDEVEVELAGFRVATIAAAHARQVRPTGATAGGRLRGKVRHGRASYLLGYPAWAVAARAARRIADPPFAVGSAALVAGYLGALIRREERVARDDVVRHLRAVQARRLRRAVPR